MVPTENNSNMAMETLEQDELVTSAQALSMPTGNVADFNPGNNTIKPSDAVN